MITRYHCGVRRDLSPAVLICFLFLTAAGCVPVAALWANITGGNVIEPQFALTKGPLLVLVDDRNGIVSQPRALREVHKTVAASFLKYKVNRRIVPYEDLERLKRSDKSFDDLSTRQIGEKLGAEQVLYIDVERFTLHAEVGAPLFKGSFSTRVKVLSTKPERDVRLWPREPSGRRVTVTTTPIATDSGKSASDVARELATKMGREVAKLFYEHRELDD